MEIREDETEGCWEERIIRIERADGERGRKQVATKIYHQTRLVGNEEKRTRRTTFPITLESLEKKVPVVQNELYK